MAIALCGLRRARRWTIGLLSASVILGLQLQGLATGRGGVTTVTIDPPGPQRIGGAVEISIDEPRCGRTRRPSIYRIEIIGSNPAEQIVTTDASGHAAWSYAGANMGVDRVLVSRQGPVRKGCRAPAPYETSYEWLGESTVVKSSEGLQVAVGDVVAQLVPDGEGACRGDAGVDVLAGVDLHADVTLYVDEACRVIVSEIVVSPLDAAEDEQQSPVGENVAPSPGTKP